jgi:hypothetical protein
MALPHENNMSAEAQFEAIELDPPKPEVAECTAQH